MAKSVLIGAPSPRAKISHTAPWEGFHRLRDKSSPTMRTFTIASQMGGLQCCHLRVPFRTWCANMQRAWGRATMLPYSPGKTLRWHRSDLASIYSENTISAQSIILSREGCLVVVVCFLTLSGVPGSHKCTSHIQRNLF